MPWSESVTCSENQGIFIFLTGLLIFPLTCGECRNCGIWKRSGLQRAVGRTPLVSTHFLGLFPDKDRVIWWVSGGKSTPWNVTLSVLCGITWRLFFPFSAEKEKLFLLLRLQEGQRSDVASAHSLAHKTQSSNQKLPEGSGEELATPQH